MKMKNSVSAVLVGGLVFLAAAAVFGPAAASTSYQVQPGDTFSSIAASHYGDAAVWRALWKANPQVSSPRSLSVGQELTLPDVGDLDIPRTYRRNGMQVVRLSPEPIAEPLDQQVFTIPRDAIQPFLERPRVFGPETAARSPYIVGQEQGRLTGGQGDVVYARGLPHAEITHLGIYREGGPYYDVKDVGREMFGGSRGPVLGYEGVLVATADLIKYEPDGFSTLRVTQSFQEVLNGDVVLPLEEGEIGLDFAPEVLGHKVYGRVIKVPLDYTRAGQFDLVYLNVGAVHGVKTGALFDVMQIPNQSYDPRQDRNVTLPMERMGQLMVVRTFERISFAIVLESSRSLRVADLVESADSF